MQTVANDVVFGSELGDKRIPLNVELLLLQHSIQDDARQVGCVLRQVCRHLRSQVGLLWKRMFPRWDFCRFPVPHGTLFAYREEAEQCHERDHDNDALVMLWDRKQTEDVLRLFRLFEETQGSVIFKRDTDSRQDLCFLALDSNHREMFLILELTLSNQVVWPVCQAQPAGLRPSSEENNCSRFHWNICESQQNNQLLPPGCTHTLVSLTNQSLEFCFFGQTGCSQTLWKFMLFRSTFPYTPPRTMFWKRPPSRRFDGTLWSKLPLIPRDGGTDSFAVACLDTAADWKDFFHFVTVTWPDMDFCVPMFRFGAAKGRFSCYGIVAHEVKWSVPQTVDSLPHNPDYSFSQCYGKKDLDLLCRTLSLLQQIERVVLGCRPGYPLALETTTSWGRFGAFISLNNMSLSAAEQE